MGMYDELYVRYPLPDPELQNHIFQTTNLDCLLRTFIISEEGRLLDSGGTDTLYNGDLWFYEIGSKFLARFVDGQLQKIVSVPYGEHSTWRAY